MSARIQTESLTKRYGKTLAVDSLDLEVGSGEILGLLGPNGAGKSTTLSMLCGLVRPTSGSVTMFGKDLHGHFREIAARIGVLTERPAFYDYLTTRENLKILSYLAGRETTVDHAIHQVGLLPVAGRKVGTLSMGMRQRLGLAQALLLEPEVLLLDEPCNGLDPEATQEIVALLRQLAEEARVTVVFSSHMLHEVEAICDRAAIMNHGKLVACDRVDALLSHDLTRVDVLLDSPEAAAKRLQSQDWVDSAVAGPGKVTVVLREPNPHRIIVFLNGAGYRISGVVPHQRTLQDYFVKVLRS